MITYPNVPYRKDFLPLAPTRPQLCVMRYTAFLPSRFPDRPEPAGLGAGIRWTASGRRLVVVLLEVLIEVGRYACGSPHSRLHQCAALRELDARLLMDIGALPDGTENQVVRQYDQLGWP
jgi:hypothetical protein